MKPVSRTWDAIAVGDEARTERIVTPQDLVVFAHASGNRNPLHMPEHDGTVGQSGVAAAQRVAPSMLLASLFSGVLGNALPGPGTLYLSQTARFLARAQVGDRLTVVVRVAEKQAPDVVLLATTVLRGTAVLVEGEAMVRAPLVPLDVADDGLPTLTLGHHQHVERLLDACAPLPPLPCAVVAPEEEAALSGALDAARQNLIVPILIGDAARIRAVAATLGADLAGIRIEDCPTHDAASARAVELVHEGAAGSVMKGHLHTDELLRHVVKSAGGLRTGRRLSHVFVMDAPSLDQLLLVTDAAIAIAPTLEDKIDITQNAIDLGRALGIAKPKVGVLSAVEIVNTKIPSSMDAAILSKMAERGQIKGGLVDGPLALDNAISLSAARTKGITGLVAGRADILVVPNLEAGNILAKDLTYVSQAEGAGLVVGAKVPIMLTSRADDARSRLFSCAVAVLMQHWLTTGESAVPEQ